MEQDDSVVPAEETTAVKFYKRRAFAYLMTACAALIFTALAAIFFNNHPKFLHEDSTEATAKSFSKNEEAAIALKKGNFHFKNEKIESVMHKIAYRYKVKIIYEGPKPDIKISATISREQKLSEVLKVIELTGAVHFRTAGQTVYVMR